MPTGRCSSGWAWSRCPLACSGLGRVGPRGRGPWTMTDPLAWIASEANDWSRRGLERRLVPHGPTSPGRVEHAGRPSIHFGSNDYLGLAADPRVVAAAHAAAEAFGWGAGASPLVTGWTEAHD